MQGTPLPRGDTSKNTRTGRARGVRRKIRKNTLESGVDPRNPRSRPRKRSRGPREALPGAMALQAAPYTPAPLDLTPPDDLDLQ